MPSSPPTQLLLSLPPAMARAALALHANLPPDTFAASDPSGSKLGSGGGTAHLLAEAWRATGGGQDFAAWLGASRKLIVHGGGQSRRLPAYAATGKPFLPVPVLRRSWGQRLDQTLLDLQLPGYRRVLAQAPSSFAVLVTSGDVLLRFDDLDAPLPDTDVLAFGMTVEPDVARNFGVFLTPRGAPGTIATFLQKPAPAEIRALQTDHEFLVDTGMWLLSERAVRLLMARSGWDANTQRFAGNQAARYELYADFGLGLGARPQQHDAEVNALRCAVVALPAPEFYHLGASRQLIESVAALQNHAPGGSIGYAHPSDQFVQSAILDPPTRQAANRTLWIENATIPASWTLAHEHVLTGVPDNDWELTLDPGVCLDFVPVGDTDFCVRVYGMDDAFSGALADVSTRWLGRPATAWFAARGLDMTASGLDPHADIQQAALFPVLPLEQIGGSFLRWLFAHAPDSNADFAQLWQTAPRLSAEQIPQRVHLERLYAQRAENLRRVLPRLRQNPRGSVFFHLDLETTARVMDTADALGPLPDTGDGAPLPADALTRMKDQMLRAVLERASGTGTGAANEAEAFAWLRRSLVRDESLRVHPARHVLDDQILWGRSPVRLDLAGGWTDTPPYCLEHGGRVVNLAVNLNGQPPVQVFARPCSQPHLVIRSIDLGAEERVTTYDALDTFARPGSEFALAKAALALAGFLPRFHATGGFASLAEQLADWGGGIELSLLAAVPKGSGLGTSSVLSATVLATLAELCGLSWDRHDLVQRTLVLEQMLTTGGGWQDQAGALFRGIKLIETAPGLEQTPTVRWLPEHLFGPELANRRMLLYYTGLTRLARDILQDIVRGMFLNRARVLESLDAIGQNAEAAFRAVQRGDYDALCASVRASWACNQQLDAGTNPPAVQAILDHIEEHVAAAKLLGAGGGGYLFLMAHDEPSGAAIREILTTNPPNDRARFVDFSVSETGLQVTRS